MDMHKHEKELGNDTFSYTAHMGLVYMFIEVKKEVDQDIFIDPPRGSPSIRLQVHRRHVEPGRSAPVLDFSTWSECTLRPRDPDSSISHLRVLADSLWKDCPYNVLGESWCPSH